MHVAGWAELRTAVAGVDPGLERLRLAAIGSASMVLAVVVMAGVRALTGQPVTLADLRRGAGDDQQPGGERARPVSAGASPPLLMLGPAAVAVTAGTLLAPHRLVADVVFVGVTSLAVYVRRFGPRGFALGMAGFMPYFFTQFLQARTAELPWLLVAAATGLGATLLLRGYVFAEREERTLARLLRAFRAHVHGVVVAVAALLAAAGGPADRVERARRDTRRRRARLNTTALLVADRLDRLGADDGEPADLARAEALEQRMLDVELAAERLAIATRRLAEVGGPRGDDRDVLLDGLRGLGAASATGTPHAMVPALLDEARHAVAGADGGHAGPRGTDAAGGVRGAPAGGHAGGRGAPARGRRARGGRGGVGRAASGIAARWPCTSPIGAGPPCCNPHARYPTRVPIQRTADPATPDAPRTLRPTTRQAVQAGVAVALSIVVGELVSPSRWYWAAVAAFVVFAGTHSRGDILSRGWQRILGTVGGVAAGDGPRGRRRRPPGAGRPRARRLPVPRALPRADVAGAHGVLDHRGARADVRPDRAVQPRPRWCCGSRRRPSGR